MAGNVLGLCFLIFGVTGIVNGIYLNQGNGWNTIQHPWNGPMNKIWSYEKRDGPLNLKYRRISQLNDVYGLSDYEIDKKNTFLSIHHQQKLKFGNRWLGGIKLRILTAPERKRNTEGFVVNSASKPLDKDINNGVRNTIISIEKLHAPNNDGLYSLKSGSLISDSENAASSTEYSTSTKIRSLSSMQTPQNTTDEDALTKISAFPHMTENSTENTTDSKASEIISTLGTNYYNFTDENTISATTSSIDMTEVTSGITESSEVTPNASTSYTATSEKKEPSSSTPSTYSESSDSSTKIQPAANRTPESVSSITPNSISTTTDEHSSVSSAATDKTTVETTEYISSTIAESVSFTATDKTVVETTEHISSAPDESSSVESTSSRTEHSTQTISPDHVINISSIRTARVIVTTVFLVITLISVVVLAIYIFRIKRKAVRYDELLLIP